MELAFRQSTAKHGVIKNARVGYSQGLCFQPTWAERIQVFKKTIQPGMMFHLHGGIWAGMWGGKETVNITESIAITDKGFEQLTHTEQPIFVKD